MATRDRAFDRKLETLLVQRLRDGQVPEVLLADLKVRLDPAEAEALMSRARAQVAADAPVSSDEGPATATATPTDRTARILAGLAYGWTAVLVFQNIIIVMTAGQSGVESLPSEDQRVILPFLALALAKIVLLCAGLYAFRRWRGLPATAVYVLTILFAFPLGLFVHDWMVGASRYDARSLLTVSAICSYAASLCAVAAYLRTREAARPPISVEAFD